MKKDLKKQVRATLKSEQEALQKLNSVIRSKKFWDSVELLRKRKGKIIVTGVGKSGFVAMKTAATLTSLGHHAFFLSPLDALHGDSGVVEKEDVVIAFSFSGASIELVKLVKHLRKAFSIKIITITGKRSSELAKNSDAVIVFSISTEGCPVNLAPMASTTASLVIGDLIASALTSLAPLHKKDFARFHPAGSLGLSLTKVQEIMWTGKKIPQVEEKALFREALKEITDKKLGVVGIVSRNNRLMGVITDGDIRRIIMRYLVPLSMESFEVMTKNPKSVNEEDTLLDALSKMEKLKITSIFVVNKNNRLMGVVHIHDILGFGA